MTTEQFVSHYLPRDARDALVAVAAVNPSALPGESRERACKLDEAVQRIKFLYPQFFRHTQE